MSCVDIALCSLTVLVGSTLQGSVGFGMGLFASPILMLIDERFVPAPILLSTWVMTTFLVLRERHDVDVRGLRLRPSRSVLVGAGMMSAIMGTITSISGPPMALVYQDASGARLRATMSSFFWVGTVMSLVVLRLVGRFGEDEVGSRC